MIDEIERQLVGEDFSGVTFVRDYLQLQFNPPPMWNVYSRCDLRLGDVVFTFGDSSFPNAIISCIGKPVLKVSDNIKESLVEIELANDAAIILHYADGTFDGPEAIEYFGKLDLSVIWP